MENADVMNQRNIIDENQTTMNDMGTQRDQGNTSEGGLSSGEQGFGSVELVSPEDPFAATRLAT